MLEITPALPGCKQVNGESPPMAVERLLRERFPSIADLITLRETEKLEQTVRGNKNSVYHNAVRTKYIRTMQHGVLELEHEEFDVAESSTGSKTPVGMSGSFSNFSQPRPRLRLVNDAIGRPPTSLRTQISVDSDRSSPRISVAHVPHRTTCTERWSGVNSPSSKPRQSRFTQWAQPRKEKEREKEKKTTFSFCDNEAFKDDQGNVYVWLTGKQFDDLQVSASHQTVAEWIAALERRHEQLRPLSAPVTVRAL